MKKMLLIILTICCVICLYSCANENVNKPQDSIINNEIVTDETIDILENEIVTDETIDILGPVKNFL